MKECISIFGEADYDMSRYSRTPEEVLNMYGGNSDEPAEEEIVPAITSDVIDLSQLEFTESEQELRNLLEINSDGEAIVTSKMMSEKFGIRHHDILRFIRQEINKLPQSFTESNFAFREERVKIPNTNMYTKVTIVSLTERGFMHIAMKLNSPKAITWQIKFGDAFILMRDKLFGMMNHIIGGLKYQIECQEYKVTFFNRFVSENKLIGFKVASDFWNINGLGRTKLLELFTTKKYVFESTYGHLPYEVYKKQGLFIAKANYSLYRKYQNVTCDITYFTPKGFEYFTKKLQEWGYEPRTLQNCKESEYKQLFNNKNSEE